MTEDDTFNTLRRIPFSQMIREWSDIESIEPRSPECLKFFEDRGWNWDDYMEIYHKKEEQGHPDVFPE